MKSKPMNLVFIFSDEHSRRITGCYGHPLVKTPNIDALAANGTRFENAYCNFPICLPSRASMTTGQYAFVNGYWDNAHPYAGEAPGWGHRLRDQGYTVVTVGKLHYKGNIPETGFSDQRIPLNAVNGIGDLHGCIRGTIASRPEIGEAVKSAGPGETPYIKYDMAVAEEACRFLKEEAPLIEKPWVLFVGFVTPHFPLKVPENYYNMYPLEEINLPVNYKIGQRSEHPVIEEFRRYFGFREELDDYSVRKALAAYYGLCTFMDEQVGKVLSAIDDAGFSENTRIIYTADHGDSMGENGLWFKHSMYEGSAGVPMILSGPDIPKGRVLQNNVSLIDIFPTILDCVGAKKEKEDELLPGTSLWEIARGESSPERDVFCEYHAVGSITGIFMIRHGEYKYIYYEGYPPQLYNLKDDPDEGHDLAALPEYAPVLEECDRALRRIVDPKAVDSRCKAEQMQLLEKFGGIEQVLNKGLQFAYSPPPAQFE